MAGEKDMFGHAKLGGIGQNVSNKIKELAPQYNGGKKIDMISMNLSYLVRSGAPDAIDCIVPTAYGNLAVDLHPQGRDRPHGRAGRRPLRLGADREVVVHQEGRRRGALLRHGALPAQVRRARRAAAAWCWAARRERRRPNDRAVPLGEGS